MGPGFVVVVDVGHDGAAKGVASLIRCFSQARVGDAVTATWTTLRLRNPMITRTYRIE